MDRRPVAKHLTVAPTRYAAAEADALVDELLALAGLADEDK